MESPLEGISGGTSTALLIFAYLIHDGKERSQTVDTTAAPELEREIKRSRDGVTETGRYRITQRGGLMR